MSESTPVGVGCFIALDQILVLAPVRRSGESLDEYHYVQFRSFERALSICRHSVYKHLTPIGVKNVIPDFERELELLCTRHPPKSEHYLSPFAGSLTPLVLIVPIYAPGLKF